MKAYWILAVALALAATFTSSEEKKAPPPLKRTAHRNVNADEFEKLSKEPDTVSSTCAPQKNTQPGHIKNSVLIDFNAKDLKRKSSSSTRVRPISSTARWVGRSAKAWTRMDTFDFPSRESRRRQSGPGKGRQARREVTFAGLLTSVRHDFKQHSTMRLPFRQLCTYCFALRATGVAAFFGCFWPSSSKCP